MQLKFLLTSWSAWSADKTNKQDWVNWAKGIDSRGEPVLPDVSGISAMKRRRMSSVSRLAIATSLDCLGELQEKPVCVAGSRHGELSRTVRIIDSLVNRQGISPTDFSLSVHNTALGLFSIHTSNTLPVTTVVAGEDTFGMSLIEALVHLHRFPGRSVLLVYFDEPAPEPLSRLGLQPEQAVCIALLLSQINGVEIKVSRESTARPKGELAMNPVELGPEFLRFYLSNEEQKSIVTENAIWTWQRQT